MFFYYCMLCLGPLLGLQEAAVGMGVLPADEQRQCFFRQHINSGCAGIQLGARGKRADSHGSHGSALAPAFHCGH
jgi:hypothetical protein